MRTQFDIFPWNANFQVGIKILDEQHQALVALINRLAAQVAIGADGLALATIFDELSAYAAYHFKTEEAIWHQYLPNDALESGHLHIHQEFLSFLDQTKAEKASRPEVEIYKRIVEFLTNWLVSHILETDKAMAEVCLSMQRGHTLQYAKAEVHENSRNAKKILSAALINMNSDLAELSFKLGAEVEQRNKAQASLSRALAFSKSLINSMQDGLVTIDKFGSISEVNPAFCSITGFSVKDLVGLSPPFPFCHHEKQSEFDPATRRADIDFEIEIEMRRKDGTQFPAIVSLFHINDDNDQLITCAATVKDITERKNLEEEKIRLSLYDPLTNLANRRLFNEQLIRAMEDSQRSGKCIAVAFIDLDHFKQLNDSKGHSMGDSLLKEAARRIKDSVRGIDTVSRFGGDEFVVLMTSFNQPEAAQDAEAIAGKIRAVLGEPYHLATLENGVEVDYQCSASIGVVIAKEHEISPEELLMRADKAMYLAKESGRNRVCFYAG